MRNVRASGGFTLIEIMVVVFILGLLVALVAPQITSQGDKAKVKAAMTQIHSLDQSVELFKLENGRYPSSAEGLQALVPPPPADLPNFDPNGYVEKERIPLDPWRHPYTYASDGQKFTIVSFGADGRPGGEGFDADLSNWSS